ncbi:unnamed protein product [Lymnaea stagnalis]|uniref:Potassium channel domain-containing protein n=1 Tax=Lymnaea stagnalis TaxID=6523 RepID=A0AAV2IA97_LYMST
MSNKNGGLQTKPTAAPRLQKPVKRADDKATTKQKRGKQRDQQQQQLQLELQEQLQQQQRQQTVKAQQQEQLQQTPTPQKRRCCYTCCCARPRDLKERQSIVDDDIEDDATHIASLSNHRHGGDTSDESSCCLGCCRRKKKRKSMPQSDSQMTTSSTSGGGKKSNCRKCCRKVTAFIFSHVGLGSLVVAYSIMGGFLFQWLEATDEMLERISVTKTRTNSVMKLWNMTRELNILYEKNWTAMADEILREFQASMYESVKERGWDGRDENNEDMQWSFSGSLLYSVTVITTIGYGHIAPKTDMGRLVTMFYALIGIPLTLLCLSNIGSFFANCFRFLYKYLCNGMTWLCCPRRQPPKARYSGSTATMTTTSSLKSVASKKSKSLKDINSEFEESRQSLRRDISLVEKGLQPASHGSRDVSRAGTSCTGYDGELNMVVVDEPPAHKLSLKEEIRVPMCVSLLIIALYIFGGAILFSLWEKDWNYLIGSYFCFITLSTIGFGDYVFGVGSDLDNSEKMITCALYLVLGLSIIAMCFDLMQEEVRAKCRWLGVKLGIIELSRHPKRKR